MATISEALDVRARPEVLSPVQRYRRMGLVFGMALLLQVAHFAEHVAQIYQKNVQHVKTPPHGLLGVWLDVEWAHFIYNVGLGLAIVMMFVGYRMWRKEWRQYNVVAWVALVAAMVVQAGWHVSEHAVKMYQYYAHGWNPAPGILGHTPKFGTGPFQVVYLHFWYNLAVTALLVVAYLGYRAYRAPKLAEESWRS
ncbi:MAG: hypothetical protein E6G44_04295 [Actinobacteria bacterium]|nr:MAG: hypothetical protein E6G44_04295 [Actinomycetota bacterium]